VLILLQYQLELTELLYIRLSLCSFVKMWRTQNNLRRHFRPVNKTRISPAVVYDRDCVTCFENGLRFYTELLSLLFACDGFSSFRDKARQCFFVISAYKLKMDVDCGLSSQCIAVVFVAASRTLLDRITVFTVTSVVQ
jgi:hypothetical protein